jgi:hypothetical protein
MPSVVRHRVVSPFLAIRALTKVHGFVILPVGSIIETSDSLDDPGLHSVRLGDEELFAFTRDIEERSERIDRPEDVGVRENFAGRS